MRPRDAAPAPAAHSRCSPRTLHNMRSHTGEQIDEERPGSFASCGDGCGTRSRGNPERRTGSQAHRSEWLTPERSHKLAARISMWLLELNF